MHSFLVDYYHGVKQELLFEVWDDDYGEDNELIGATEVLFSDIIFAPKRMFTCALISKKRLRGNIEIRADFINISNDKIEMHIRGELVSQKYFCCGGNNPYLLIERARLMNDQEIAERDAAERETESRKYVSKRRRKNKKKATVVEDQTSKVIKSLKNVLDWVRVIKTDFIFD